MGFISWSRDFPKLSQSPRITKVENEGYHLGLPWFCLEFSVSISLSVHYGKMAPFPGTKHAIPQRRTEAEMALLRWRRAFHLGLPWVGRKDFPWGAKALPKGGHQGLRGQLLTLPGDVSLESLCFLSGLVSVQCFFSGGQGVRGEGYLSPSLSSPLPHTQSHTHTHTHTHSPAAEAATGKHCCARIGVQGFGFLEEPPAKQEATTHHHFF